MSNDILDGYFGDTEINQWVTRLLVDVYSFEVETDEVEIDPNLFIHYQNNHSPTQMDALTNVLNIERRQELLRSAGILNDNSDYNQDIFPNAYAVDKGLALLEPTLAVVAYRVNQSYNTHIYYIKDFNLIGISRWYITVGSETYPETFNIYSGFKNGFETVELALDNLIAYLKSGNRG